MRLIRLTNEGYFVITISWTIELQCMTYGTNTLVLPLPVWFSYTEFDCCNIPQVAVSTNMVSDTDRTNDSGHWFAAVKQKKRDCDQ